MPELLRFKTNDWEFTLWANDITHKQSVFRKTMARYNKPIPSSKIFFSKKVTTEVLQQSTNTWLYLKEVRSLSLDYPLFFENTQYQFEWVFFDPDINNAFVAHKLTNVNNSFRFSPKRNERDLPRLIGGINTGNDIGWLKLPFYFTNIFGKEFSFAISLEVLPTKMDMASDLINMYKKIDSKYPLWRFNLANKTEQSTSAGNNIGHFPLLWLAHFESLREKMLLGLKVITNNPHSNLNNTIRFVKAEKLMGKLSNKQVELLQENIKQKFFNNNYRHTKKFLSLDTPENRFIKRVVNTTKSRLIEFHNKIVEANSIPENQQLSSQFINEIEKWHKVFSRIGTKTFLNEISDEGDLEIATIVLQQKTGYNTVYKIWQEMKFYLDMFDSQSTVSMKTISEIYELWCFLEIREIITNTLNFNEVIDNKRSLSLKDFEYRMKDGFGGAFEFERNDGSKIRLAHEPIFNKRTNPIRTYLSTQKPDILMEVTLPNGNKYIWIFDAKYRIETNNNQDATLINELDLAPEDALNQMHRYRDALINTSSHKSNPSSESLSRPVFGSFALYPGYFDQELISNPYNESIEKVGIGAFALLPSSEFGNGSQWLKDYLLARIGLNGNSINDNFINESLSLQSPARIPMIGMNQNLYKNLLLFSVTPSLDIQNSIQFFLSDTNNACVYQISKRLFKNEVDENIVHELKFIAIAGSGLAGEYANYFDGIWPIKTVELKEPLPKDNNEATVNKFTEPYWQILLGQKLLLKNKIRGISSSTITSELKLTTLELLEGVSEYAKIQEVFKNRISSSGITRH